MKHVISRAVLAVVCATMVPLAGLGFQAPAVNRIGGGVSSPQPIYKPEPAYTEDARASRIEGDVMLQVVINAEGVPSEVNVVKSLDKGLDLNAIETMMKWRFKPGMKDGKPVAVQATMQMTFKLQ